jgi:hypothetical protein
MSFERKGLMGWQWLQCFLNSAVIRFAQQLLCGFCGDLRNSDMLRTSTLPRHLSNVKITETARRGERVVSMLMLFRKAILPERIKTSWLRDIGILPRVTLVRPVEIRRNSTITTLTAQTP